MVDCEGKYLLSLVGRDELIEEKKGYQEHLCKNDWYYLYILYIL